MLSSAPGTYTPKLGLASRGDGRHNGVLPASAMRQTTKTCISRLMSEQLAGAPELAARAQKIVPLAARRVTTTTVASLFMAVVLQPSFSLPSRLDTRYALYVAIAKQ